MKECIFFEDYIEEVVKIAAKNKEMVRVKLVGDSEPFVFLPNKVNSLAVVGNLPGPQMFGSIMIDLSTVQYIAYSKEISNDINAKQVLKDISN